MPEQNLNSSNIENFFYDFSITPENNIFVNKVVTARINSLVNNGTKTLLIIDSVTTLMENMKTYVDYKYGTDAIKDEVYYSEILQSIKTLCAMNKSNMGGSLTTILIGKKETIPPLDRYLTTIKDICNKVVNLDK